jgi:hypothetical protein
MSSVVEEPEAARSLQRKAALTAFLSLAGAAEPSALAQRFLVRD